MENKINHGLKFNRWDKFLRDIDPRRFSRKKKLGAFFDTSKITDFDIAPNHPIYNQGNSYLCTAFSNTVVSGIQENVELSPEYAYQKTLYLMGVEHSDGANPDSAMKAHTRFGCIERKDSPFSLDIDGQYKIEDPQNWDLSLDVPAAIHKKQSYMKCDQGTDLFDSIRISMWISYQNYLVTNNKSDLKAVSLGFNWLPDFQYAPQGIISNNTDQPISNGSGHNVVARGQKTVNGEPCLIVQNSYGTEVGDLGLYYFPRAVVNKYAMFADVFSDQNPADAKKAQWGFIAQLLDGLIKALTSFANNLK